MDSSVDCASLGPKKDTDQAESMTLHLEQEVLCKICRDGYNKEKEMLQLV